MWVKSFARREITHNKEYNVDLNPSVAPMQMHLGLFLNLKFKMIFVLCKKLAKSKKLYYAWHILGAHSVFLEWVKRNKIVKNNSGLEEISHLQEIVGHSNNVIFDLWALGSHRFLIKGLYKQIVLKSISLAALSQMYCRRMGLNAKMPVRKLLQ